MPAHALSGGQRQMLAISLLFVQQPRVLLLDEPIEGLSQDKASDILHGIETYVSGTDATVLLVEHNTTFVLQFRSAISFMSNGTITQTLEATAPDTESRLVDLFLGA